MVIDMEKGKLEKCPTTGHKPVYLQVSLDGKIGLCSLAGESAVGLINIPENKFLGTIPCGESDGRFFDRDFGFHKNRQQALCTNTAEKSISLLDLKTKKEVRQIKLPGKPGWMKMLS